MFSLSLFIGNAICWFIIFIIVGMGPKLVELISIITVPLRFIFVIILCIHFTGKNKEVNGKGIGWYLGGEAFPLPPDGTGIQKYMSF